MLATATDYRLEWILREGDTIQTAEATYTITGEPIGLGGSSVLYPASKSGSYLEYAIKEYFSLISFGNLFSVWVGSPIQT